MTHITETDIGCFEICSTLKKCYDDLSTSCGPVSNIIGLFFHDIVAHFTGVLIHRTAQASYGDDVQFPWVNKQYAMAPFIYSPEQFSCPKNKHNFISELKKTSILPVAGGHAIPFGYGQRWVLRQMLNVFLAHPDRIEAYLENRPAQLDYLQSVVMDLCRDYEIVNASNVWKNWQQHTMLHSTDNLLVVKEKGVVLGTRNDLHNRKLAINFLQQGKEVIAFTHGEISSSVLDEPVYGYSEKTLCTTLVDYGDFLPSTNVYGPILPPKTVLHRSSDVVKNRLREDDSINSLELAKSRILFIPTIYQENELWGPKHAYESEVYHKWHMTVASVLPDITLKLHPKTRYDPVTTCSVDHRRLDDCIDEYDVIMFDFFSTAAVLAIYSNKPVIYFDIGLRTLDTEFLRDLEQRCAIIDIDFSSSWEEQIRSGLSEYEAQAREYSNCLLPRYALCERDEFQIVRAISDIILH